MALTGVAAQPGLDGGWAGTREAHLPGPDAPAPGTRGPPSSWSRRVPRIWLQSPSAARPHPVLCWVRVGPRLEVTLVQDQPSLSSAHRGDPRGMAPPRLGVGRGNKAGLRAWGAPRRAARPVHCEPTSPMWGLRRERMAAPRRRCQVPEPGRPSRAQGHPAWARPSRATPGSVPAGPRAGPRRRAQPDGRPGPGTVSGRSVA